MKKTLIAVIGIIIILIGITSALVWINPFTGDDLLLVGIVQKTKNGIRDYGSTEVLFINKRGECFIVTEEDLYGVNYEDYDDLLSSLKSKGRIANPIKMHSLSNWLKNYDGEMAYGKMAELPDGPVLDRLIKYDDSRDLKDSVMLYQSQNVISRSEEIYYSEDPQDQERIRAILSNLPIQIYSESIP